MKPVNRFFRYTGYAFFGLVGLITLLTATLVMTHWNGALEFLLGA